MTTPTLDQLDDNLDPTEASDLYELTPDNDPDPIPFGGPGSFYLSLITGRPLPNEVSQ